MPAELLSRAALNLRISAPLERLRRASSRHDVNGGNHAHGAVELVRRKALGEHPMRSASGVTSSCRQEIGERAERIEREPSGLRRGEPTAHRQSTLPVAYLELDETGITKQREEDLHVAVAE